MKTKLTITIDEELLPLAKRHARSNGISLSQLIESALRTLTSESRPSFSDRWRGRFEAAGREDERYDALARKYLKILVDTDVLIDVALDRAPHAAPAGELLDRLQTNAASGFMAWHSASNFYYLVSPKRGKQDARSFLLDLTEFIEIAPSSTESLRQAARLALRDFEDAMQVAAAMACGADVIATRNVRDYARAPIDAATPASVLKLLANR